jgi:hypothetical protein
MAFMETLVTWAGFTTSYKLPLEKEQTLNGGKTLLEIADEEAEKASDSKCPSKLSAKKVKHGQKRIEEELAPILFKAWKDGFAVSSNFAREKAGTVAMAASMQLITTKVTGSVYSSNWQITAKGIRLLNELDLLENDNDYGC